MGIWCLQASSFIFDRIFVKLADNQNSHKISEEFENSGWIESVTLEIRAHKGRIKFSIDILWNLQVQLTFQTLEFFVTLFSGTVRPRRLKLGTHVGSGQMYRVSESGCCCLFIPLFLHFSFSPIFNIEIFHHTFFTGTLRPRRLKIGTRLDSGQMYHVYQNQAAASYSSLYFFISLSHQFSNIKFFITPFSGTVRPRRLKLGTHIDSGQMYHVYQNQDAAAYSSPYFFIFLSLQFSTLKFFVTLFSGTMRPRRLKLGIHMDSGQMYHVYQNQAAASYSSLYFFIFLSLQFSTLKFFITLFSGTVRPRRLKLGTHIDSGQMYHVYQNQAAAAYSSPYFFFFFSLQFSTLKFFVTLFSGTMRPRRLKLGIHMDSGQTYHVYQNQAAAAYLSLYFFIFLSLQFSSLNILVTLFSATVRPRRLDFGIYVDSEQMYHVHQNQASAAFLSLYFFIFLSLQFSTLKFFVGLFSGTMKPRRLKIVTIVDSGQMYHVYQNQAAAAYLSLYFFIFLSLQFSNIEIFVTLFSGTVRPRRLKLGTNVDSGLMYRFYWNQASAACWSHCFIIFLSLQFSNIKIFCHTVLTNCEA